jgi:hypothetical protein
MNSINDINGNNGLSLLTKMVSVQEFLDLWMPVEVEIGQLAAPLAGAGARHASDKIGKTKSGKAEQARRERILRQRRELLERVFYEAENGDGPAREVVQSLETVMKIFAAHVLQTTPQDALFTKEEAEPEKGRGESGTPGHIALQELSLDTEFLRHATAYATRLQHWMLDAVESGRLDITQPADPKPLAPRPQLLPAELLFFNDAVHATAVKALSRPGDWEPMEGFAFAFRQSHDKSSVTIGLPTGKGAADLWEYLRKGGPRMVKAHYALWARYYHDVDEGGMHFAVVHVSQFCADIGLKKHKNGGYRKEQKQDAVKMLHALTSVVMSAEKTLGRKLFRVRGPLWTRGLEAESRDVYNDLFGQSREGEPNAWEPVAFSFAPGPWFHDPEWRRYHRYVGKVGVGLLQLDNREEWAILVGGYLAMLGRANAYRPLRLKVETILEEAGLVQSADARRRHAENRAKFENALDRLAAPDIGVIESWRYLDCNVYEPDMDDATALAEYSRSEVDPPGAWRDWMIEITLPYEIERERLQASRDKAIIESARKARGKKSLRTSQ